MKSLLSSLVMLFLAATGSATTVTVNASATGTTTSATKTAGTILVSNPANRGYAVFNLSAASIPDAATITSVQLIFNGAISGSGTPSGTIYGYAGDISPLGASALFSGAITSNVLYTSSWGVTSGTITMTSTAAADTFIQNNHLGTISTTWVESASTRVYNITGGTNPQLRITYVCNNPAPIVGATAVCSASTITLTDSTIGGTWSSATPAIASVSGSGIVRGLSQGAATISYTKGGCSTVHLITVKSAPGLISGVANICLGSAANLTNGALFGSWTSSNPSVASIDIASGRITSAAAGTTTVTYNTGCGSPVTKAENVITAPAAISGTTTICQGANATLADATTDGSWTTSNSSIASINAAGAITGVAQGTAIISYGMASCIATTSVLVKTAPATITGPGGICNGSSSLFTNTSASGTWSTTDATVASVNAGGLVISVSAGNAVIRYATGCGVDAVKPITVDVLPTAPVGPTSACVGNVVTVTDAVAGGGWSSSNASIASVSNLGAVSGIASGNVIISYTLVNGCGTNSVLHNMNIAQVGYWLGTTNTNWNDAANWACNTVPDSTTDVVFLAGTHFMPAFSAASYAVKGLTVSAGVTLAVNGGANISVRGNFTNNGIVNGNGAVTLNGTSAKTVYGTGVINNLIINNASGVAINPGDSIKVATELVLTNGAFTTNNGLLLLSDVSGTGRIAPITGGTIAGNVNIQQYFNGGRRAYRFFGHPFNSSISLSMLSSALDITGSGGSANGFTTTGSNAPSSFRYNPALGNSSLPSDPGWRPFTNANANADTNEFKQYQGIRLFVRGAKTEGLGYGAYTPSATTITMAGQVNTGTQVITLHTGALSDYNQVSNPYPSPTNIGNVIAAAQAAGQVTGAAFYVWNPFLGFAGAYEAKIIGMSYVLDQNSSFQVRAVTDGATLTFHEDDKAPNRNESLLRAAPSNYITLKVYDAQNHPWDMMYLSFNENATNTEDKQLDATKTLNPDLNFYTYAGSTKFAVDARPYTNNTIIPVGFTTNFVQSYTIKAENMALPADATLYLHDKMLNRYVLLTAGTEYTFDVTADKATQGENRFELTANNGTNTTTDASFNVTMSPNPATDNVTIEYKTGVEATTTVKVMNITGATVITKTMDNSGKATLSLKELPAGVYMVEVTSGDYKNVQKLIKE